MENITISSKIDSTFEFEMTASGIDLDSGKAVFQTEISSGINYDVDCKKEKGKLWSVTIPKGLIPNGAYNFSLCVIVDEYFFEPVTGKINVVSAETIKVSGVQVDMEPEKETPSKKTTGKTSDGTTGKPSDGTTKKAIKEEIDASSGQSIKNIKRRISERQESKAMSPFFKTEEDIKEEKYEKREFDTIYPAKDVPKSAKPKYKSVFVPPLSEKVEKLDEDVEQEPEEIIEENPIVVEKETPEVKAPEIVENAVKDDVTVDEVILFDKETPDVNERVRNILSSTKNPPVTPPELTVKVVETQKPGKFFEDLDAMKELNEKRKLNKKIKDVIKNVTKK
jgi:hypothetical protein